MLYEVAIIVQPTKQEAEAGGVEKLIMPPTAVIAKDERSAGVIAVSQATEQLPAELLARAEVLVRPFC